MVVNKQGSVKSIKRKARKSRKVVSGRAKEFSYKGYSLEDLQKMSLEELIKILPARAWRTLSREDIKTHVRDVIILPNYVGKIVEVYNGNSYFKFEIKPEMIGHYLGEFVMTRKEVKHSGPGVGATRSSKFMPLK